MKEIKDYTDLELAKISFSDASINLEIAQGKYNEAKQKLIAELHKPIPQPQPDLGKQEEKK
jgi:hypothetical protein